MSLIAPVQGSTPPVVTLSGVSAGGSDSTLMLAVQKLFAGRSSGSATSTATLTAGILALSGTSAGVTQSQANLRIVGQPSIFMSGLESHGAASASAALDLANDLICISAGRATGAVSLVVRRPEELGFMIFVDMLDPQVAQALSQNIRQCRARLRVGGVEVPVRSARLNAALDMLGTDLEVELARPDASAVSPTAIIDFDVGVWIGTEWRWSTWLAGGVLAGRTARYQNDEGLPADTVTLLIQDSLADRQNRAPRAHVILYDPERVEAPAGASLNEQAIYTQAGARIAPVVRAISNMRLHDVLREAFVVGCGFAGVETNIENFPIEQVVFSVAGGYDAGVRPFLKMFEPIPFVVDDVLWLISQDFPIPAGFAAREFPASASLEIDDEWPAIEPVNAVLVRLRDDGTGEYFTERTELQTNTVNFGTPQQVTTEVERRYRDFRNFDAPEHVTRSELVFQRTTNLDSEGRVVNRETQTDSFDALNRHTGYRRTVEMLVPDLDAAGARTLLTVFDETQFITYAQHPFEPMRDTQDRVETHARGLIFVNNEEEYLGAPFRAPFLDAHRSGALDTEADQTTEFGPIRTTIETLRVRGEQVQRERRVFNHLTQVPDSTQVEILPGSTDIDRRAVSYRTLLLTVDDTDATGRRVQEFDGTALPPALALRIARGRLARLNSPPRQDSIEMSYVDTSMRRGMDLLLRGRGGSLLGTFIVRGFTAEFQNDAARMSLTARELKP